eukprot:m.27927 g.27927  ORF g.27927 m.27927 type:complete len:74 (-) comp15835_c0_seq1:267-488(-)
MMLGAFLTGVTGLKGEVVFPRRETLLAEESGELALEGGGEGEPKADVGHRALSISKRSTAFARLRYQPGLGLA